MEHDYFPLLKLKMWFFVQEYAAELPFLSPVKIIFQKFSFFSDIVADLAGRYTLCAHCSIRSKNRLTPLCQFKMVRPAGYKLRQSL